MKNKLIMEIIKLYANNQTRLAEKLAALVDEKNKKKLMIRLRVYISNWLYCKTKISAKWALVLEAASENKITKEMLAPHIFGLTLKKQTRYNENNEKKDKLIIENEVNEVNENKGEIVNGSSSN
jgi:DNA-binding transcriptional regulator YdaS (Cro superfamily)